MTAIWVVTIKTTDNQTIHVHCLTLGESENVVALLVEKFGPAMRDPDIVRVDKQPVTWECDGRDGCLQNA